MSRTDKDVPYWARYEWFEASHLCWEHFSPKSKRACDLLEAPKIEHHFARSRTHCEWLPTAYINPYGGVPKWYVNHVWTAPERVRVRDELGEIVKEYNADGNVESEFQNYHHRHSAKWLWS